MSKRPKTLVAAALALVLALSSIQAFGASLNENDALVTTDESQPVQAAITKILRMPVGTTTPDATFNFTATPISIDEDTDEDVVADMPALNADSLTVSFTAADVAQGASGDNTLSAIQQTGDIFDGVTFPYAGIYEYEIRETALTNSAIDSNTGNEILTYSTALYTLTVYVANLSDGSGTYVMAVGTKVTTPDNSDQDEGDKVDPTPGGDNNNYYYSQMIFTNDYVKINGPVDPENPDPANESTLNISKTVTGDFGSLSQLFDFTLTLEAPSLLEDVPPYYRAYVVENGAAIDPSGNAADALVNTGATPGYIRITPGQPTNFMLTHGQQLVLVDTPVGTSYEVAESAATHYIPSVLVTTNSEAGAVVTGSISSPLTTGSQLIGELTNSAAFTNNRDSVTPTGLNLNDLPFIGLITLAAGALVIFVVVKSRRRKAAVTA